MHEGEWIVKKKVSPRVPKLLRISEATRYLGVSRGYIQKLLDENILPCVRLDGYKIRIAKMDLDEWVRVNRVDYERADPRNKQIGQLNNED